MRDAGRWRRIGVRQLKPEDGSWGVVTPSQVRRVGGADAEAMPVGIGLDEGALVWAIQEENLRGTLKRRAGLPDPFRPVQRNGGRLGEERIQQLVHGATKIHDHPYSTSSR